MKNKKFITVLLALASVTILNSCGKADEKLTEQVKNLAEAVKDLSEEKSREETPQQETEDVQKNEKIRKNEEILRDHAVTPYPGGTSVAYTAYDSAGEKMFRAAAGEEGLVRLYRMWFHQEGLLNEWYLNINPVPEESLYIKSLYDDKKLLREETYKGEISKISLWDEKEYSYDADLKTRYCDGEKAVLDENMNVLRLEKENEDGEMYLSEEYSYDEHGNPVRMTNYSKDGSIFSEYSNEYEYDENGAVTKEIFRDLQDDTYVTDTDMYNIRKSELKSDELTGWWGYQCEDTIEFIGCSANGYYCVGMMQEGVLVEISEMGWYRYDGETVICGTKFTADGLPDEREDVCESSMGDFLTNGECEKLDW